MITNFKNITYELTDDEMRHVDGLVAGLELRNKDNPIKAPEIVRKMNVYASRHGICKMTEPRLRKLINHIRSQAILPVIATSKGYYISYDEGEVSDQIKSLTERANSMLDCVFGLKKFL